MAEVRVDVELVERSPQKGAVEVEAKEVDTAGRGQA